jgi:hypothetical protein
MERQRDQFLARAAAAGHENRRLRVGDFLDQFQDVANRFALADDAAQLKFHDPPLRAPYRAVTRRIRPPKTTGKIEAGWNGVKTIERAALVSVVLTRREGGVRVAQRRGADRDRSKNAAARL